MGVVTLSRSTRADSLRDSHCVRAGILPNKIDRRADRSNAWVRDWSRSEWCYLRTLGLGSFAHLKHEEVDSACSRFGAASVVVESLDLF